MLQEIKSLNQRSSLKYLPIIKLLAITLMYCNKLRAWWSTQSRLATLLSSLIAHRWVGGSIVVDFLFIVTPIVGVCNCSMFCCTLLYVHSSIAIILMGKRELIALLNLSSWCLVMVERLFLAVPRGCLQFVIVVFPDHTHLLFFRLYDGSDLNTYLLMIW